MTKCFALSKVHYSTKSSFPSYRFVPLHYFLGLGVQRSSYDIFLHQSKYLLDLLGKTNMEGAKPCSTLLRTTKLDHSGPFLTNPIEYRSIVRYGQDLISHL